MEAKFTKRPKRNIRQRSELEENSMSDIQPTPSPTLVQQPAPIFSQPDLDSAENSQISTKLKPKIAPAIQSDSKSKFQSDYYSQSSYSSNYLAELKQNQQHANISEKPIIKEQNLEPIRESEHESEKEEKSSKNSELDKKSENSEKEIIINVPMESSDAELSESDKEKAQEARELRKHIRKRSGSGPDLLPDPNEPDLDTDEVQKAQLYKVLYIDKKPITVDPQEDEINEEQQIKEWENELLARGLGKRSNEEQNMVVHSADKLTVKNQLSRLLREIKTKCSPLSIESVQYGIQQKIRELEQNLSKNTTRLSEISKNKEECKIKLNQGETNKKQAFERENFYSDLLAYITDLEDLYSIFYIFITLKR